jgi:hypothetical protein
MKKSNKNQSVSTPAPAVLDQPAVQPEAPAPAPALSSEEQAAAQAALSAQQEAPAPAPAPAPAAAPVANSKRDAFGGRIGTRMSRINLVVIESGKTGATIAEVAAATGETKSLVSSQLSWMVSRNKGAIRKVVAGAMRYYAASANPDQTELALS